MIEAATENYDLNVKILKQIDNLVVPEVIIASNTSSSSITKFAAMTVCVRLSHIDFGVAAASFIQLL